MDFLHSLLHFVVESAFVAWTHDAQVFLAKVLEEGMNGESVMDMRLQDWSGSQAEMDL